MSKSPSESQLPHFPVTLSNLDPQDAIKDAKKIVLELRPDWRVPTVGNDLLQHEIFAEGKTNAILSIWNEKFGGRNNRILLRIYGEKTDLIIDRDAEKRNMALLHQHGCAAPVYGTFENGVIYGYIPGRVAEFEEIRDPHIADLIAKQMAKMHTVGYNKGFPNQEGILFSTLRSYIDHLPSTFDEPERQQRFITEFPSKQELLTELESIRHKVESMQAPIVFCHNDLSAKNVIYDEEKDAVHFIDYEYAGYNYQAFDIGNHFCEYAGNEVVDFSQYPDRNTQKSWLRNYLKCWQDLTNGPSPTDHDVDVLYVQANVFAAVSHFWWAVWAVIQARYSTIDYDFLQYGIDRLKEYKKLKDTTWTWTIPEAPFKNR